MESGIIGTISPVSDKSLLFEAPEFQVTANRFGS
jgi:hypothetical protein